MFSLIAFLVLFVDGAHNSSGLYSWEAAIVHIIGLCAVLHVGNSSVFKVCIKMCLAGRQ